MVQLLMTMRGDLARRYARDKSLLDVESLFKDFKTVHLIGMPNFSMRVSMEESEADAFKEVFKADFIVEPDYFLRTFRPPFKRSPRGGSQPA